MPLHLFTDTADELMGQHKHKDGSTLASVNDVRNGLDVVGQLDTLEVLYVFVFTVNDLGELFTIVVFLKHPLTDFLFKKIREVLNVLSDNLADS
jgi:hypothetical protein